MASCKTFQFRTLKTRTVCVTPVEFFFPFCCVCPSSSTFCFIESHGILQSGFLTIFAGTPTTVTTCAINKLKEWDLNGHLKDGKLHLNRGAHSDIMH
jgi:hypothetical protein